MNETATGPISGQCQCGARTYSLSGPPLFTHICHCLDCQRTTGTAFGMTVMFLTGELAVSGPLEQKQLSPRSTAQVCPACNQAIYISSTEFPVSSRLNVKTMDDSRVLVIGAHIWAKRKHDWLQFPAGVGVYDENYQTEDAWPADSLVRLREAESRLR